MIEVYKILTGIYDPSVSPKLPLSSESVTRGNSFKIINRRCHYDLRKYSLRNRVTNLWNSLPDVVVTAPSLNTFKNRLDKHWINTCSILLGYLVTWSISRLRRMARLA